MSRTPRNDIAVKDFAKAMTRILRQHGSTPSPKEVELTIYSQFDFHVSDESIRKALKGEVDPMGCSLELLAGLAAYFGISHADLGEFAQRRLDAVFALADPVTSPDEPLGGVTRRYSDHEQAGRADVIQLRRSA